MNVIATANVKFFIPMVILPAGLSIAVFVDEHPWDVTLAHHVIGPFTAAFFYATMLYWGTSNVVAIAKRRSWMWTDGKVLHIWGYWPIRISQIKSVEISDRKRLVITQISNTTSVSGYKFNENIDDVLSALRQQVSSGAN